MQFKSLPLLSRFLLVCVPPLVIVTALQFVSHKISVAGLNKMRDSAVEFEQSVYKLSDLSNLKSYLFKISISYRNILLSKNLEMREGYVKERASLMQELSSQKSKSMEASSADDKNTFNKMDSTIAEFVKVSERFDKLWRADGVGVLSEPVRIEGHAIITDELVPLRDQVADLVASLLEKTLANTRSARLEGDSIFSSLQSTGNWMSWSALALTGLLGITLALTMRRLSGKLLVASAELSSLGRTVKNASSQVASASHSLAVGASEAASSLESTSTTIRDISEYSKTGSQSAVESSNVAGSSLESAKNGQKRVVELVAAVERISECSSKIGEISKLIDDVAFQTNLLALNAAVEAARAGDAGKGFAVVAEEVRGLAQRCSKSAKSISDVVEETVERVNQGLASARSAGNSLDEIISGAERVSQINSQVSEMISQQQRQIDEVSKSMCKLDGATQANAAASEETAASAQELTRQAEHLDELADDLNQIVKGAQNDTSRYGRPAHYEDNSPVAPLNSRHRTHNQYDDQVIQ